MTKYSLYINVTLFGFLFTSNIMDTTEQHSELMPKRRKLEKKSKKTEVQPINNEDKTIQMEIEPLPNVISDDVSNENNFTILGDNTFERKERVEMALSSWLAYPRKISDNLSDTTKLEDVQCISEQVQTNLKKSGISSLFPVQAELIPWIINAHSNPTPFLPRDICVSATTGSGKTLAFVIPIIEILKVRVEKKVRALIVLPVQELARQVAQVFKELSINTGLTCALLSNLNKLSVEQSLLIQNGMGYVLNIFVTILKF